VKFQIKAKMPTQLIPHKKQHSKKCLYCRKSATGFVRAGVGRIGFYFDCCPNKNCVNSARNDANDRVAKHIESMRLATLDSIAREGETIRHRLVSKLGITLGWNGKFQYARPRN